METSAHDLGATVNCKTQNCTGVSLGAIRGPYAGLCDRCTEAARTRQSSAIRSSTRDQVAPRPGGITGPGAGAPKASGRSLAQCAADLVRPARALERAVATKRKANRIARDRLAEFSTALDAVKEAAEALLR
ncbi:MAG TPA: hypothetical protein VG265_05775 [Gaiellaceae bacterium]|jgi:hypothetical protein|nr:hypothetical protein [Gaiellaceae bacterium]